jgi:hypothetical protein
MRTPKQLFNEIVKLAESVVKVDEVKDVEVQEEVVLAEETQEVQEPVQEELSEQVESQEELAEEPMQDMPVEESPMEDYVSRGEFEAALKEMKEMYTKVLEVMSPESGEDVPADLAQDESITEELSSQEDTDTLVHTPDAQVDEKKMHLYAQGRKKTTEDYVFASLFKK